MKHIQLILLISFFIGLFTLWFTIHQVVSPLRQSNNALKKALIDFENPETEIIKNGKVYEIIEKY